MNQANEINIRSAAIDDCKLILQFIFALAEYENLAHEVVASEVLDARVAEIVAALLQGGPRAQAAAKDLIRAVANRPVGDEVVEDTARRISSLRATPEAKEGLDAFLSKRLASWVPKA